jgi:hypothetical protein
MSGIFCLAIGIVVVFFVCCYYCFDYRYTGSVPTHGEVYAKATLYRDILLLLFQRLACYQHFSKPAFDTKNVTF